MRWERVRHDWVNNTFNTSVIEWEGWIRIFSGMQSLKNWPLSTFPWKVTTMFSTKTKVINKKGEEMGEKNWKIQQGEKWWKSPREHWKRIPGCLSLHHIYNWKTRGLLSWSWVSSVLVYIGSTPALFHALPLASAEDAEPTTQKQPLPPIPCCQMRSSCKPQRPVGFPSWDFSLWEILPMILLINFPEWGLRDS